MTLSAPVVVESILSGVTPSAEPSTVPQVTTETASSTLLSSSNPQELILPAPAIVASSSSGDVSSLERCRTTVYYALNPVNPDQLPSAIDCKTRNSILGKLKLTGLYAFVLVDQEIVQQGCDIYLLTTSQTLPDNLKNNYIWYTDTNELAYSHEGTTVNIIDNLLDSTPLSETITQKLLLPNEQEENTSIKINLTDDEFNTLITSNGGHELIKHHQYILMNPLTNHQSNHAGFGKIWIKKLPGYREDTTKIIAGGEISFNYDSNLIYWDLKSGTYSANTDFNESSSEFSKNFDRIRLPRLDFLGINYTPDYHKFYSSQGKGSFVGKEEMKEAAKIVRLKHAKSCSDLGIRPLVQDAHNIQFFRSMGNSPHPESEKIKKEDDCDDGKGLYIE